MSCKIYKKDIFNVTIKYTNKTIIINIIDDIQNIYEENINIDNLNKICIFNVINDDIHKYYLFLINAFEDLINYDIVLSKNNPKFIRIVIKEKIYDSFTIKNVLWIKIKKNRSFIYSENITYGQETNNILHEEILKSVDNETIYNNRSFSICEYITKCLKIY